MARVEEWVGGRVTLPFPDQSGPPLQVQVSIWLEVGGPVVAMHVHHDGEGDAPTLELLQKALHERAAGRRRTPGRIRVADAGLAAAVQAALGPGIEVITAPTPELTRELHSVTDLLLGRANVTKDALIRLQQAADRLYRLAPWELVPKNQAPIWIECPELDLDGVALVSGQPGPAFSLGLFLSSAEFMRYVEEIESAPRDRLPPCAILILSFEDPAGVPAALLEACAATGWDRRSPLLPVPQAWDRDDCRPLTLRDVESLEALSISLAVLVEAEQDRTTGLWKPGVDRERLLELRADGALKRVRLRMPAR